jgi:hypothetical protein
MHSLIDRLLDSPFSPLLIWVPFAFLIILRLWWWQRETGRQRTAIPRRTQPWWLVLCWVLGGLAFDWCSAFRWFAQGSPSYSAPVIYGTSLIAMVCTAAAFLVVWVRPKARWRDTAAIFFLASFIVLNHSCLTVYWIDRK